MSSLRKTTSLYSIARERTFFDFQSRMNILIIGGGIAGLSAADGIHKHFARDGTVSITIVEPNVYFEVPWASIRAMFDSSMAKKATIPMSAFIAKHPKCRHVRASLSQLSRIAATFDNGESMSYDVCLLATGSRCSYPILNKTRVIPGSLSENEALSSRREELRKEGDSLKSAKSVLVVGGGAIGTEVAGDISGFAKPGKKPDIRIVHARDHLVPELNDKAAEALHSKIEKLGVTVSINDKAILQNGEWRLESTDEVLKADHVVETVGVTADNGFMKAHFGNSLDEHGWIQVDKHYRVEGGYGKVFAIGDCCNAHQRTGVNALGSKQVIRENIVKTINALKRGTQPEKVTGLLSKGPDLSNFIVTAGPQAGIAQTNIGIVTWPLVNKKNSTMFISKVRKDINI